MSGSEQCVEEMLQGGLINVMAKEAAETDNAVLWLNVAKVLLAVVAYRSRY